MESEVNNTEEPSAVGLHEHRSDGNSLCLKDFLDLYSANITPRLTGFAQQRALSMLRESSVTINTVHKVSGTEEVEYEHTYPVIRRIADPDKWVLPRGRIIYEPDFGKPSVRYTYRANQFKPLELKLAIDTRYHWRTTLNADRDVSRYEVCRNDTSDYIPVLNTNPSGPGDRFIIFNYFHVVDYRREQPVKIFYKYEGDYTRFHCVSIPLKLLSSLVGTVEDSRGDGCIDDSIL